MTITRLISLFIIGTIPILFGAVQPWVWSLYCLAMMVVFILALWSKQIPIVPVHCALFKQPVVLFFIWSFLLCLPIPFSLLSMLSPVRAEILSKALMMTDSHPTWQAISYSPRTTLGWWAFLLGLALFFLVLRHLCKDGNILKSILFVLLGIGLFEAAYGLLQALMPSMGVLWVDYITDYLGTARGTFINRNNYAGFIEMVWPLMLGAILSMSGRTHSLKKALDSEMLNRQVLMALGLIVLLLALIFTRSRAGIACGLVGVLLFSAMVRTILQAANKNIRALLIAVFALLGVYTMSVGIGPVFDRFFAIRGDSLSRRDIWQDSLPMILDHPLGIGLGNYATVFPVYNRSSNLDKMVIHTHNDYLQLLIETGWLGFFLLTGGWLLFLIRSARRIKALDFRADPLRFFIAVGAFSGLVSISVHSFFDFNLQIPANCLYFVVLMAILSACTQPSLQPSTHSPHDRK